MADVLPSNLYVHFPFCRRKCTYCVLHSRVGQSTERRRDYVDFLCRSLRGQTLLKRGQALSTIYFGGGSPALCDLTPLFDALAPFRSETTEFTVELHPLDVTPSLLDALKQGGVNRISMGVQSLDDDILRDMGRGYTADEAERAFAQIKARFDNAGVDLIVGYPQPKSPPPTATRSSWERLAAWGLRHCSVYSLILEEGSQLHHRIKRGLSPSIPTEDAVLDEIKDIARFLRGIGLERYEISNYAVPGCECRHNLATWRGEDYLGLGEGACGRLGLSRTRGIRNEGDRPQRNGGDRPLWTEEVDVVSQEQDALERRIFRLRTREGLDATGHPEWLPVLARFTAEGLLIKADDAGVPVYRLTERGTEVCDSILAELV